MKHRSEMPSRLCPTPSFTSGGTQLPMPPYYYQTPEVPLPTVARSTFQRRALLLLASTMIASGPLTLGGCASVPKAPVVRTVEVSVPVAVPCDPKVSPEPDWSEVDAELRSQDPARMLRGAYAGYKIARAYIKEQATGLKACAAVTTPP